MKIEKVTAVFSALRQESRLNIFRILVKHSAKGITPTEISALLDNMPRNTLSSHLLILFHAGLCSFERSGKQLIYKPNCKTVKKAAGFLLKDCCEGGCEC